MQKRGQITVFIIIGIVMIIVLGIFLYLSGYSTKAQTSVNIKEAVNPSDTNIVKTYAESCLKLVSDDALFNRIGLQGGYINPDSTTTYGEPGVGFPLPSSFQGKKVPYYLTGEGVAPSLTYSAFVPDLELVKKKFENYILVEFEKCFSKNTFKDIGLEVEKPHVDYQSLNFDLSGTSVNISAEFNKNDVYVNLNYPIVIKRGPARTSVESFNIMLPIGFKVLYESAAALVNNTKKVQPNAYDISTDCSLYDKNGFTNVYLKESDSGSKEIVQFVDFSTYYKNYLNAYIFQFAVKNVNIKGSCTG
ncbi:MAG: hypothetical protein AABX25_03670 [Nanoarchaeota archaeon]